MRGGLERCPICRWEDDLAQLRFARMPGGANHVSLEQGQHNDVAFGAAERRHIGSGRTPLDIEPRESEWRPLDPARDKFAGSEEWCREAPVTEPRDAIWTAQR